MAEVQRIVDDRGAAELADRLNGNARTRPIVVITTPAGRREPYIDPEAVLGEVDNLADVYLIATGPHTWTFSEKMPDRTQVYGGAGRAYPVGHDWVAHPHLSPLRFAYNEQEGQQSTRALIADALRLAAAAGLVQRSTVRRRVHGEAQVMGFPAPGRALVKLDGRFGQVAQELTLASVSLDRVLAEGMRVTGYLDLDTHRLDITGSLLPADDAVRAYQAGDVVLTEVASVHADQAELLLHPEIQVSVTRIDVTGNELDDLRDLMTPGEVMPARIRTAAPAWRLSLADVDDDEIPIPAAALIAGGPPWLTLAPPTADEPSGDEQGTAELANAAVLATSEQAAAMLPAAAPEAPARPTPAIFDKHRRIKPAGQQPKQATESMTLTIDALRGRVRSLEGQLDQARDELRAGTAERADLVRLRQELEQHVARLEHELLLRRTQLRKAKKPTAAATQPLPEFADRKQGFKYAVLTAWARRTPVGEQPLLPLPDYDLGEHFLESLELVPGIRLDKVVDVAVEILTGRVQNVAGRQVHQLRESLSPGAFYVRRPSDDATCWRAALQVNSPQARRIHYWIHPGGRVEFSRVTLHDDYRP
jgi:hypothetical protein